MDQMEGCNSCTKIPPCGCYYSRYKEYEKFCDDCVKEQERLGSMK